MNNARLYHSNINELGFSNSKRQSSDKHNIRYDFNIDNILLSNTKNNILYINGKKADPTNSKENFEIVQKTCDDIKNNFIKNSLTNDDDVSISKNKKAELQIDRTKLKLKLKKWSENEGAGEDETKFFKNLYEEIGNKKFNSVDLIEELGKFGKVKRFNDKRKALSGLDTLNVLVGTQSINTSLSLITKEILYKIPEQWEKKVDGNDFLKAVRAINKKFYPEFNPIYETVHNDEQSPHVHLRLSGFNNETKKFDMQDTLYQRIKKINNLDKNRTSDLPEKKYSQLNQDELKIFGEIYQDQIFKTFNKCLSQLKYDFEVIKRTPEEKKNDFKKFLDSTKPIAEREFNMQKHLKIQNEEIKEVLKNTIEVVENKNKVIKDNSVKIEKQKLEINNGSQKIEEIKKETKFWEKKREDVLNFMSNGLKNAIEYAMTNLPQKLKSYLANQEALDDLRKEIGDDLYDNAYKYQKNDEQRNNVKNGRVKRR